MSVKTLKENDSCSISMKSAGKGGWGGGGGGGGGTLLRV